MKVTSQVRPPDRPGRPIAHPERDSRVLLLNAATALFAEIGVAATSFSTIARRAGLTPAMVHYHFRDRDKLIDAVVEERLVPLLHYVWNPVQPGDPPEELLSGLVTRLLDQVARAPWLPSTWMREILNDDGLLRGRMLQRLPIAKVRIVGEALAQGMSGGRVNPDIDPLLTVFSAVGLVMLHAATLRIWADVFERPALDTEALRRHITGILLKGISPLPTLNHEPASSGQA